ncbi:MAG: LPXTG cell wall anchor domain-containing protein [Clostridia bacterium]|nr:LPXTG cell wall anchor domain-containing protein [Clostridia bacterium]
MKKIIAFSLVLVILCSMVFSASAVEFTPSVEKKDAPEIVPIESEDGTEHDAIVYDKDGKEEILVDKGDIIELVVTSVAQKDQAMIAEITEILDNAEKQVGGAEHMGKLSPDMYEALRKYKEASSDPLVKTIVVEDFVCTDLFDVSLVENREVIYALENGQKITFQLQTNLKPGDVFFIINNCTGEEWNVVDSYVLDENGVLTITVSQLCPWIIVRPFLNDEPSGPDSPQTGYNSTNILYFATGFAALSLGLASVYFVSKKKANKH